jgi:pyruvate/2-oxoglutarate dehydrogenase complex dihydrolipoamide acyltransferase (E2) component
MTPVLIPHENVNDESVAIVSWRVANGEKIEKGQAIAEVEGSKAAFDIHAPVAGIIRYSIPVGGEVAVGAALCDILDGNEPESAIESLEEIKTALQNDQGLVREPSQEALAAASGNGGQAPSGALTASASGEAAVHNHEGRQNTDDELVLGTRISRKAAELLAEHRLDAELFRGRGLITSQDVLTYLREGVPTARISANAPSGAGETTGATAAAAPSRREPLSRAKRTEIKYLDAAHRSTLPSLVSVAVPTMGLARLARQHLQIRGNLTGVVLFEAARLLRKYPLFNAFHSDDAANLYQEVNIGYALDAGQGLKVLVIRNADSKSLPAILGEMQEQLVRYLNDEVQQEDLARGTFTITDLSGEGVVDFVPLLNRGQSAILGIGGEVEGETKAITSFRLILAFDHQLSEGRQAAKFLNDLRSRLAGHEQSLAAGPGSPEPAAEESLHCSECLLPIDEIEKMGGHLLQKISADRSVGFVCTKCSAGF